MVRPKIAENEMEKLQKQSEAFDQQIKDLSCESVHSAPVLEQESQTKLSSKEIEKSNKVWLKPVKTLGDGQKFNERFREEWNFKKEYVQFIAEHKELIGETIEIWTHPFGGVGAEFWNVPVNKPVWGPRYLAEQIRSCKYNRLGMEERYTNDNLVGSTGVGSIYGKIVVQNTIQRLTAEPINGSKSIFMGAAA